MPRPVLTDVLRHLGRVCAAPECQALTDADLLHRFLADREETAFALLVQRHGPMVLGVCRRVLGDFFGAEDAFQATFLVLARRGEAIRNKDSMASWLYGVALRIAHRARHRTEAHAAARLNGEGRLASMRQPDPLDDLTWQELRTVLDEEIGKLPEKYRAPIVLCYFQDKSHEQAALELGWPKSSLTSRVSRGRELLRTQLVRRGIALSAGVLGTALCEKAAAAPVGALLILHTVKAVTAVLAGHAARAGHVSAAASALAEEAIGGGLTLCGKLAVLALVLALAIGGAGVAGFGLEDNSTRAFAANTPPAAVEDNSGDGEKKNAELYNEPLPQGALARLGTTRFRMGNRLYAMALSPDGQTVVAVTGNAQTQFWDVATGKAIRRINWKQGGGGRVVAYSPDGKLVASVQDHGMLHLWDASTGKQLAELTLNMNFTTSLGFSPDCTVLAAGGFQAKYGTADVSKSNSIVSLWQWDGMTLKPLWEAKPDHEAPLGSRAHSIQSLAFSPDGKQLATGGGNNTIIRIWDVKGGKELLQIKTSGTEVGALAFAPFARALAAGSDDGALTLWDTASGAKQWETKLSGAVRALAFAPDGKILVGGGGPEYGWTPRKANEPFLLMLDAVTGKDARPLAIARDSVASLAFSKDGKVLAAGLGGTLRFWHGTTGKERSVADGHENWISTIAVAEDGQAALTAGGDGLLILWDTLTGHEKMRLKGHQGEARAAVFVPGGKLAASASTDQTVRLWDLATGNEVQLLKADPAGLLYSLVVSPDGKLLAAGDYHDGSVYIWDVATAQLLHRLKIEAPEGHGVMRLAFAPDCKTLAVGETVLNARLGAPAKGQICLWDALTGKKLREFPAHTYSVDSLAFSPDGNMLASAGSSDKTIILWDMPSGKKLFDLKSGSAYGALVFSPDGKTLVCGGFPEDGIGLWEIRSKKLRRKFSGYAAHLHSLAFSPDGKKLLSGGMDSTGLIWDVTGLRTDAKPPSALSAEQLQDLWKALASADAAEAGRAIWSLAGAPKQAVPYLADRLRDVPSTKPDQVQIRKLIADLDSDDFDVRQSAQTQLEAIGKRAEPALRKALAQGLPLEVRRRIESVLEKREAAIETSEVLQVLRALEALEHVGTLDARRALAQFAKQSSEGYFQHEATAAVLRLANAAPSKH